MTVQPLQRPGRTAVRITGDYYHGLLAWQGCVRMLRDQALGAPNPIIAVGVEVIGAGNLDDIVFWRRDPPHTYQQVKYAADSTSPVNTAYLTMASKAGGPSILGKIADTYLHLAQHNHPVDLALVTNRAPDPDDVLIAGRDPRTHLLLPAAGEKTRRSAVGAARQLWAHEAGLTEEQLIDLLAVLRFRLAKDLPEVEENTSLLMQVAGLRGDLQSAKDGANWVAQRVRDGRRRLDADMVNEAVKLLGLRQGPARAILSVATLKPDPLADQAAHRIEWFERLEGADAFAKRRPAAPATWAQLQREIEEVPQRLGAVGRVAVTGSLRQATAFTVGAALRMVTNIDVATIQRGELWSSGDNYDQPVEPATADHPIGQGPEIAIAIEVAARLTDDVLAYVRDQGLPVDRLVVLRPPAGAKDRSIPDSGFANALAVGVRDHVRRRVRGHTRVHLFLAGPMGLALLLGHRWNRVAPTIVYEEILAATQYEPAFTVSA